MHKTIISKLQEEVRNREIEIIQIAFLCDKDRMLQWIKFISSISQAANADKIAITIIQPKQKTGESNPQFDETGMMKFLSLLTGKEIKIMLISNFDEFKNIQKEYDIITHFFHSGKRSNIESQVLWLKEHHPESSLFFSLEAHDNPYTAACWEGAWKWNADSKIDFLSEPTEEHRKIITNLMA